MEKRILITGGQGFVGIATTARLLTHASVVVAASESKKNVVNHHHPMGASYMSVERLPRMGGWRQCVDGCGVVVHLAGRAHLLRDSELDPLAAFRKVNVDGTLKLAQLARDSGVKRFVFVSSIGVNGNSTFAKPISEASAAAPHADYALSKWEAEEGLWNLFRGSDTELVIIRPPLVYAGHAPGNFGRLLKFVAAGVPVPLGAVRNKRSMIALENLVDFIALCTVHPAAANELFVIADEDSVSTPQIIRYLAEGMEKSPRLLPVPPLFLRACAKVFGQANMYSQLCESLIVDSSKAQQLLGWRPVISVGDGLKKAGRDFLSFRHVD